jgi:hypothetical protein
MQYAIKYKICRHPVDCVGRKEGHNFITIDKICEIGG